MRLSLHPGSDQPPAMRLGYNTNGFAHHRLEDALAILADLGYQSIAITIDYHALNPFDSALSQQLEVVCEFLVCRNLHSVIETGARFLLDPWRKHQPTLLSASASERRVRLDFLKRSVDIASKLGSDAVSFWSGTAFEESNCAVIMDRLVDGCRQLSD